MADNKTTFYKILYAGKEYTTDDGKVVLDAIEQGLPWTTFHVAGKNRRKPVTIALHGGVPIAIETHWYEPVTPRVGYSE